ncbi:hypothetical protein Tco_1548595 [Tanacetum coccineum]
MTHPHYSPSTSQPQKKQKPRKPKRKDTEVPQPSGPTDNVGDEVVYEKMDDSLERAATTVTSLDVEQDKGVNTHRSDEDSLKLKELTELCTNLQNRVIDLEKTKTSQAQEIISLKRRVKILEKKGGSRTHGLKRLYKVGLSRRVESSEDEGLDEEDASKQGRIADIDVDAGINLVSTHFDADTDMFGVNDLEGDEVIVETEVDHEVVVETEVASKDVNLSIDEVTLAQALTALKSEKPKADKVMLQELEQGTIITTIAATTVTAASRRPKAKGLVIHEKEQATTPIVSFQQPSHVKLNFDEDVRLAREKDKKEEEANIVSWDNELVEGSELRAEAEIAQEISSKRAGEELEHENAKKQKVDEDR